MDAAIKSKIETWLSGNYDEATKQEIRKLQGENNDGELTEAFYQNLEFGTGGLRGLMGVGTNRVNKYTVGMATQGFSNYLKKTYGDEEIKVVIGHDSRNNSRFFAETTANVFAANGIKVFLFEALRPTPELSFAIRYLHCQGGVVCTASHNPKEYNGYKAYWNDGGQLVPPHDKNVIKEVEAITSVDDVKFSGGESNITIIGKDMDSAYINMVKSLSVYPEVIARRHDLKIVYTPIHGTGITLVPQVLKEFGFTNVTIVEEQSTPDGNFPTVVYPNPEESEAMSIGLKKAKEMNADILLGTDPDADRVGIAIKNHKGEWVLMNGNQTAVLHFIIYAGFIIINIEVLEIVIDGLFGSHRVFAQPLGRLYPWLINSFEVLAVGVFTACVIFLLRRNVVYVKRLWMKELDGWPRSDANYILVTEILLMTFFLTMNSADTVLQERGFGEYAQHQTGNFVASALIHPLFSNMGSGSLMALERTCWWLHIVGIFAFLNYLPYSKHLHILFAFPNTYYGRLAPKGKIDNMPEIQKEVLYAMQPELAPAEAAVDGQKRFGAKDIFDLSWKNLLDAYSCTECGRCTAACPANLTGKVLSPRLIMMKTRDRAEEVGRNINTNKEFKDDGKSLLHDYITEEELRACTTCQACVEECPVSINPLDIIVQLRRFLIMEESNAPQEWNAMFSNTENNFAPWKFSPDERDKWAEEPG